MKLNARSPQTFEEFVFATLLDTFAIDYACQITFQNPNLKPYDLSRFTVDFVVYDRNIVFEIDGPTHRGWRAKCRDRARDAVLRDLGFMVVRITNNDLREENIRQVASRLWELCMDD